MMVSSSVVNGQEFNVLSLFSGMNCDLITLKSLGITPTQSFASEIKKWATDFTSHNFPDTVLLGDVMQWRSWKLPKIHLLVAGSPCQSFSGLNFSRFKSDLSVAGVGLAGVKSSLFFVAFEILNHLRESNPDILFLFENVLSSNIISDFLRVEPILTNNLEFACSSRNRLWFTNIGAERCVDVLGDTYWKRSIPDSTVNNGFTLDIDTSIPLSAKGYWLGEASAKKLFSDRLSSGVVFREGDSKQTGCIARSRNLNKFGYSLVYQHGRYRYHSEYELRQMHSIPDFVEFPNKSMRVVQDLIGDGWAIGCSSYILRHLL